jgi:hypothetical protein
MPYGDPFGLVAVGEAFQQLLKKYFSCGPVPVVGTAGGIMLPDPGAQPLQPNPVYPPLSFDSHPEATLAMWRWIAEKGPPWFFGLTLSDESVYYERLGEPAPVLKRMAGETPVLKRVLNISTGGDAPVREPPLEPVRPIQAPQVPAPAVTQVEPVRAVPRHAEEVSPAAYVPAAQAVKTPVHARAAVPGSVPSVVDLLADDLTVLTSSAAPQFHVLLLTGNLPQEWLFDAARRYWDQFRPLILPDISLLAMFPDSARLYITVLTTPESAGMARASVRAVLPGSQVNLVLAPSSEVLQEELDHRAKAGTPFE